MNTLPKSSRLLRANRGSVLITALVFAAIIAISLTSYLKLTNSTLNQAQRGFYNTTAMNLAEVGLERAMYCFNRSDDVGYTTAWTGWTTSGNNATNTFTFDSASVGPGASATVRVYAEGYNGSSATPKIVAKATVTPLTGLGPAMSKFIEVNLRRRSQWSWGIVARDAVRMNSNASTDSWISDSNNDGTKDVNYSSGVRRDNGSVGVVNGTDAALGLDSNAAIYGTANTGGGTVSTNSNVRIYSVTTPGGTLVDTSRINTDFAYTFPPITVPSPGAGNINYVTANVTNATTFPSAAMGTVQAPDGKYYYKFAAGTMVNMTGSHDITINDAKVVFLFESHSGVMSVQFNSNENLVFSGANAAADIYTDGNVLADSNCNFNLNGQASKLIIYGTNTTPGGQTIVFNSNIKFYGCVNAPNANIRMDSNTEVFGAIIGNRVQMDSNSMMHYDESLANMSTGNPFAVSRWKELQSATERAVYATALNF